MNKRRRYKAKRRRKANRKWREFWQYARQVYAPIISDYLNAPNALSVFMERER